MNKNYYTTNPLALGVLCMSDGKSVILLARTSINLAEYYFRDNMIIRTPVKLHEINWR